jgi:hypothetical protein
MERAVDWLVSQPVEDAVAVDAFDTNPNATPVMGEQNVAGYGGGPENYKLQSVVMQVFTRGITLRLSTRGFLVWGRIGYCLVMRRVVRGGD